MPNLIIDKTEDFAVRMVISDADEIYAILTTIIKKIKLKMTKK